MNIDTSGIATATQENLNPDGSPALNQKTYADVAMSYSRFKELQELSPLAKTAEVEAEMKGLIEFLTKAFIDHGSEWLGCWWVCNTEYMPTIKALVPLIRRVNAVANHQDAQAAKQAQGLMVTDEARNGN